MERTVYVARDQPLLAILAHVAARLAAGDEVIELLALDPDHGRGRFAGELVDHDGVPYRHRPLRVWLELAERLELRLATPRPAAPPLCVVRLERLRGAPGAAGDRAAPPAERYGAASAFARIAKAEEPGFVLDLAAALGRLAPPARARVLAVGVNTGDELALLAALAPALEGAAVVGLDHSRSALAIARARFPRAALHELDLADLITGAAGLPDLGRFDLIVALGVLQSGALDDRGLLRRLVQDHLAPGGGLLVGLPNSRYHDGELSPGARVVNRREPELGLLIKDVAFYRKYLQQHRMEVFVTGRHDLLIAARAAGGQRP
jgi:2-polyprenyl-3-methyl-5-hydroxy-6-metoxy-1,4-benzoquinol methylase